MNIKPNPTQEFAQLEDIILETASVAMIRQDVAEISKQNNLLFEKSFDDLDFLVYATISFSSFKSRVSLVRHTNSPASGIEICVRHDEQNIAKLVCETLHELNLIAEDLIWIHPNYQEEVSKLIKDQKSIITKMVDNKIISFSDYLKKKDIKNTLDLNFFNTLADDIKNKPELIAWHNFQNFFNKHKLFLHALYTSNHQSNNENPNAGYFVAFAENQIEEHINKIASANEWLERKTIFVDAKDNSLRDIASNLCGIRPKSNHEAWEMFNDMLKKTDNVIVISNISRSKLSTMKSGFARSIIKINDDAHIKNCYPKSDILFVDSAVFLERSWEEIGSYINIFA
jgi:hypothetical protein